MGCFPEKVVDKYEELSPEKKKIVDKYYEDNSNNDSLLLFSNLKAPRQLKEYQQRKRSTLPPRRKSTVAFLKGRKKSGDRQKVFSQDKKKEENERIPKYVRKSGVINVEQRKPGKVIELPFRPHIITKIETPSQSAKTSLISNLEHHPSLFFSKISPEEKQSEKVSSKRLDDSPKRKSLNLIVVEQDDR